MDQPASGLKPRQLEDDLGVASDRKRAAPGVMEQTPNPAVPGQGVAATTDQRSKRQRAASLGLLPSSGLRVRELQPQAAAVHVPAAHTPPAGPEADDDVPRVDVFEYFAQRAGRQQQLEEEVRLLQSARAALEQRLQDAEQRAEQLQGETAGAEARHATRQEQLQLKIAHLEEALQREAERGAGLEAQVGLAKAAAAEAAAAARPVAAAAAAGAEEDADLARVLRHKVTQLELELQATKDDGESASRRAAAELAAERRRREAEVAAAQLLQQQATEAEAVAQAAAAARHQLEARCAELERSAAELQSQAAAGRGSEGDAVLVRSLRERLHAAESEAADVRRLRDQAASAHVLRERLEAAESRARRAEQLLDEGEAARAALGEAQERLSHWATVMGGAAECAGPEDVVSLLRRLQNEQIAAAARMGERAEAEAAARADAAVARDAAAQAEAAAAAAQALADAAQAAAARAERRAAVLARECDGIKAVLTSYEEEYGTAGGAEKQVADMGAMQQERVAALEEALQTAHQQVLHLESELGTRGAAAAGSADAAADAFARAEAATARATAAEAEAEQLARQVAVLTERVGRGEFNPDTIRVLHMRNNPEAELARVARDARVAELESENEALRQNIQRLEAAAAAGGGGGAEGGGGGGLRVAQLEGEANLLRRRLAEAQKASDRLQQVFTRQISTFREAMLALFGYRVEMTSDPAARECRAQFVLRPQNADEAGAELAFRLQRDGRMALQPTDYSTRCLAREVETFVDRFKSIPAFTANLTMETFQRQTQG